MKNKTSGKIKLALYGLAFALTMYSGLANQPTIAKDKAAEAGHTKLKEGFNEPLILSGLKNLKVSVGEIDSYLAERGLSKDNLEELVSDGLSLTHITICGEEDCCSKNGGKACTPDGAAILYLKVKSQPDKDSDKGASCMVSLSLVEKAKVARAKKDLMVPVWSADRVASTGSDVKDKVKDEVKSLMCEFLRDYRLANSADLSHPDIPDSDTTKRPRYKVK